MNREKEDQREVPVTFNSTYGNRSSLHIWKKVVVSILQAEYAFRIVNTINGNLACLYQHVFPQSLRTPVSPLINLKSFIQPPRLFQPS